MIDEINNNTNKNQLEQPFSTNTTNTNTNNFNNTSAQLTSNANYLDDVPIGRNKNSSNFEKMLQAFEEQIKVEQENETNLPFDKKLFSKNWKQRQEAYLTILNLIKNKFDGNEKKYITENPDFFVKLFEEAHPANQETILQITEKVIEADSVSSESELILASIFNNISKVIKLLIDKFYLSKHSQKTKDVILLLFENSSDPLIISGAMQSLIDTKTNAKTLKSAINSIILVMSNFGLSVINSKSINLNIEQVISHSNPVKLECYDYYKELFKWTKQKGFIEKLKDSYKVDLEKLLEELTGVSVAPLKYNKHKSGKSIKNTQNNSNNPGDFDFDVPVNIFDPAKSAFNESWVESLMDKSTKWTTKKELIENCIKACTGKKIINSSRTYLINCFKTMLKDSNVNVASAMIQLLTVMSISLKKNFTEIKEYHSVVIDKLKDKNKKIVSETLSCIESLIINECLSVEDLKPALEKASAPQAKENCMKLVEGIVLNNKNLKIYDTARKAINAGIKNLIGLFFNLTDDASNDVRNVALTLLAVIKAKLGDKYVDDKMLNAMPEFKKKKFDEAYAEIPCSVANIKTNTINTSSINSNNNNKPVNTSTNFNKMVIDDIEIGKGIAPQDENNPPMIDSTTLLMNKLAQLEGLAYDTSITSSNPIKPITKLQTSKSASNITEKQNNIQKNKKTSTSNNNNNSNTNNNDIDDEDNVTQEEIDQLISQQISPEITALSNSTKWNERKQAFSDLSKWIKDNSNNNSELLNTIIKFIKFKLRDFKESNVIIVKEAIELFETLLEIPGFTKKHTYYAIKKLIDKWGEAKLKTPINNFLLKLIEYQTPKHVICIILKSVLNKTPNIIKEFNSFIVSAIDEFGITQFPVKEIVDYSKAVASNTNPQIRSGATGILCVIYKYLGEKLKNFLKDGVIKEATMKIIEQEFTKIVVVNINEAKRAIKDGENKSGTNNTINSTNTTNNNINVIDSLFPRVDISKKITQKMIKDFIEGKWTQKKEILDAVEKIINENNSRILPTGLNEFVVAIKNKLGDKNKNLVRIIISFLVKFFEALGGGSRSFSKSILPCILNNLSDKMNLLREDVIKCLEMFIEQGLFDAFIPYVNSFLVVDNFEFRVDMLNLLIKNKSKISISKFDFKEMITGITACLMDRTTTIRSLGEEFFKECLSVVHVNNFNTYVSNNFKPAQQSQLKPVFEKYSGIVTLSGNTQNISSEVVNTNENSFGNNINRQQNQIQTTNNNNNPKAVVVSQNNQNNNLVCKNNLSSSVKDNTNKNHNTNNNHNNNHNNTNTSNNNNNMNTSNNNNQPKQVIKPRVSDPENKKQNNQINKNPNQNQSQNQPQIQPVIQFLKSQNIKPKHKQSRINHDMTLNFPDDFLSPLQNQTLKSHMLMYIGDNYVIENAYSNDWNKINNFFTYMKNSLNSESFYFFEILDLLLKWILIKNFEMNLNCFFNNSLFLFLDDFLKFIRENEFEFSVFELNILLEIMSMKIISNVNNLTVKERAIRVVNSLAQLRRFLKVDTFIHFFSVKIIHDCSVLTKKLELLEIIKSVVKSNKEFYSLQNTVEMVLSLVIMPNNFNPNMMGESMGGRFSINCNIIRNNVSGGGGGNEIVLKINNLVFEIIGLIVPEFDGLLVSVLNKVNDYTVKCFLEKNLYFVYKNRTPNLNQNSIKSIDNNYNNNDFNSNYNTHSNYNINNIICVSKSPILINNKTLPRTNPTTSNENQTTVSMLMWDDDVKLFKVLNKIKLYVIMERLIMPDPTEQSKILTNLNIILSDYWDENKELIQKHMDFLIITISKVIENTFSYKDKILSQGLLNLNLSKYLLTFVYKLTLLSDFFTLSEESAERIYTEVLKALLFPDLEEIHSENFENLTATKVKEGKIIASSLNGIMLVLIEKINPNTSFKVLFNKLMELRKVSKSIPLGNSLTNPQSDDISSDFFYKLSVVVVKCLKKLTEIIKILFINNNLDMKSLMESMVTLVHSVEIAHPELKTSGFMIDDLCVKISKQVVFEVVKLYQNNNSEILTNINDSKKKNISELWEIYNSVVQTKGIPDKFIRQFIQLAVRNRNAYSVNVNNSKLNKSGNNNYEMNINDNSNDNSDVNSVNSSNLNSMVLTKVNANAKEIKDNENKNKETKTQNAIIGNNDNNNNNSKIEIDLTLIKIINSLSKMEKTQYILELFSVMKANNITKLEFLNSKNISDNDIHLIKQEWLSINEKLVSKESKNNSLKTNLLNDFNSKLAKIEITKTTAPGDSGDIIGVQTLPININLIGKHNSIKFHSNNSLLNSHNTVSSVKNSNISSMNEIKSKQENDPFIINKQQSKAPKTIDEFKKKLQMIQSARKSVVPVSFSKFIFQFI